MSDNSFPLILWLVVALICAVLVGVFVWSNVCSDHSWQSFWRYTMRAGCQ